MATRRLRTHLLLSLGILAILLPAAAGAAPARMTATTGSLTGIGFVEPGRRVLANGMRLAPPDRITLRSGKLSLKMADGTTIKLQGPAEFSLDPPDAAGRTVFGLQTGRAFVRTRQRSGGEVRVNTPHATLAVRGSGGGTDTGAEGTLGWSVEGLVYVDAAGQRVVLSPGYQTSVLPGGAPSDPEPMTEETRSLYEGLDLEGATNDPPSILGRVLGTAMQGFVVPEPTVGMRLAASAPPPSGGDARARAVREALDVLDRLYQSYEIKDLVSMTGLLSADFNTSEQVVGARNVANIQESVRQDFSNMENIRFFRQTGASTRFHSAGDQVSVRERWIVNAVLPSGARFQQGGETVYTIGADPGGGGTRVRRWEYDPPFGRYPAMGDHLVIASPAVITPPAPNAPDIILTQGEVGARGAIITNSDARFTINGVTVRARDITIGANGSIVTGQASLQLLGSPAAAQSVEVLPDGGLRLTGATFSINGVAMTADTLTLTAADTFQATGVQFSVGGAQVTAASLNVSGGTLAINQAAVSTPDGVNVTLITGTIHPPSGGQPPVLTGTTTTQDPVSVTGGVVVFEAPPGAPLPTGRGEKIATGQGFSFATEVVTSHPADLFLVGGVDGANGRLVAIGVRDMGVVPFQDVKEAPADGYSGDIAVSPELGGHVLVIRAEGGRYAKILVRAGTTASLLHFDWVYNPDGSPALSRSPRRPTRAPITYEAKVYQRDASANVYSFLGSGTEVMTEVRLESARALNNGAEVQLHFAPRLSSDRQVDRQSMNVDRFGLKYFKPNDFELTLGDLSGEFTPYSLNHSLLGLMGWRGFSIGPAGSARLLTAVGPRWRPGSGFKMDGWVAGVRLVSDDLRDLGPAIEEMQVGFNVVRTRRGRRSRDTYESSTVLSMDATARLRNGLGLMAEYAISRGLEDEQRLKGDAVLLRAAYRLGPLRFLADREHVGTGFRSISGSAVSNQERTNLWARYRPNDWLSANLNLLRTKELASTQGYLTRMTVPRVGVSISPFYPMVKGGALRNLTLDLMVRRTMRASDDFPRSVDTQFRSVTGSLIQRMGDFYLTFSRGNERDLQLQANGVNRRGRVMDVNLRWRPRNPLRITMLSAHELGIPLSPIIGLRKNWDTYSGGPRGDISSRVTARRFGLDIGDANMLAVELGYELLDNNRSDLGGYDRDVLNVDLNRVLDQEGSRTAGVSYRLTRNRQESGARRFTEGQLTGSVTQQF
ncbi:MAG: FecR domain-containing protein [Armatimonadetes bacterium]|nr:FecR domain-containing protein [Armatimonadota bacterium]